MKKAIITVTIVREVVLDPSLYEHIPNVTDEQMLADEINYAENLPHEWMDAENTEWKTEGKIIEEE